MLTFLELGSIMLTSLFSLFFVTGECHRLFTENERHSSAALLNPNMGQVLCPAGGGTGYNLAPRDQYFGMIIRLEPAVYAIIKSKAVNQGSFN